jgi:flagellar protein FlaG
MSFEVPPLSSTDPVLGAQPLPRTDKAQPANKVEGVDAVRLDTIPSQPPEELGAEIDRASQRVDELKADGRQLHFAYDEGAGRVVVQVQDLDGNVLRTVPPSKALQVASGDKLD